MSMVFPYFDGRIKMNGPYPEITNISSLAKLFFKTFISLKHLSDDRTVGLSDYRTVGLFLMFSVQYSVFQHIGLMHEQYQFCPWCYEDMSMVL
jgi:hypothetical protein